jgi:hypothetical protein
VKNVTEIKRTGPPSARDVKGRVITWTLPLSAMPDKDWRQFFNQTKDTSLVCTPRHVHIYQGMMVFESTEDDVPTWIGFIDKWMATANQRATDRGARPQPAPSGVGASASDRARKLSELNEKFKDL